MMSFNTLRDRDVQENIQNVQQKFHSKDFKRNITEIYPNKKIVKDGEYTYIKQEYNMFEVFKLESYNLSGLDGDSISKLIDSYKNLSILYVEPFKIIMIHSPIRLNEQIAYTQSLIARAKTPMARVFLQKRLDNFLNIQRYREQKEYYIFIYGYSVPVLRENIDNFLMSKGLLQARRLTQQEKENLCHQMANLGLSVL